MNILDRVSKTIEMHGTIVAVKNSEPKQVEVEWTDGSISIESQQDVKVINNKEGQWSTNLPAVAGWYWNRKNKWKAHGIYYVFTDENNITYGRWSHGLPADKRPVVDIGGEWCKVAEPPESKEDECSCPSVACPTHGLPSGSASGGW